MSSDAWKVLDLSDPRIPAGWRATLAHERPRMFRREVGAEDVIRPYDHVWNVTTARWIDELAAIVFDRSRVVEAGLCWFIVRQEIGFLAETMLHETLLLAAWIADVDRVRATFEVRCIGAEDGRERFTSSSVWTLVRLRDRRPQRVDPEMRKALDPASGPAPAAP